MAASLHVITGGTAYPTMRCSKTGAYSWKAASHVHFMIPSLNTVIGAQAGTH